MKELFLGMGLVLVIGVAGFAYRAIIERPQISVPMACTEEAKMCPDGTSVGRVGPSCEFATCSFPNVSIPEINATLVLPEGYSVLNIDKTNGSTYLTTIVSKETEEKAASSIAVSRYRIPEDGKSLQEILFAHTVLSPSGEEVKSMDAFKKVSIGGREYYTILIERFEGIVYSVYYTQQANNIISFNVIEHNVTDWTDPKLVINELPTHKAFLSMLETLELPN